MQELANCLCVFDDIDAIRDKKIKKAVTDLCDELQVRGSLARCAASSGRR